MPDDPTEDSLDLRLTFTAGEVVVLWRQTGDDWRLAPAPPDLAPDLRRIRAWLLGGAEVVSEPEDLLAPRPELESLAGLDYSAIVFVEAARRIELGEP